MSNKPDWKDAPEWAMWLAQDSNGVWCWFPAEPRKGMHHWMPVYFPEGRDSFEFVDLCISETNARGWMNTLEPRP